MILPKEPHQEIRCIVRGRMCTKTPEEEVRQRLLFHAIRHRGYPLSLCSVEVSLRSLLVASPSWYRSLSATALNRRIDVAFFLPNKNSSSQPLLPYILFECKASAMSTSASTRLKKGLICSSNPPPLSKDFFQLMGYVHRLKVPYFGMVWRDAVALYRIEKSIREIFSGSIDHLPTWDDLLCHHDPRSC